jgi:hypothetical protein
MKSFANAADVDSIFARLNRVTNDSQRQWGTMTPSEMCVHLTDAFRGPLGEKDLGRVDTLFSRTVMKFVALKVPMNWPKGLKTMPAMDPRKKGTKPSEFERDKHELEAAARRFLAATGPLVPHPLFGNMSPSEWKRWAWMHMDHHLRQFGV